MLAVQKWFQFKKGTPVHKNCILVLYITHGVACQLHSTLPCVLTLDSEVHQCEQLDTLVLILLSAVCDPIVHTGNPPKQIKF